VRRSAIHKIPGRRTIPEAPDEAPRYPAAMANPDLSNPTPADLTPADPTTSGSPPSDLSPSERKPREVREIRNERRMSDVEAMMWNVEKDPYLSSTFGSITVLEKAPDFDRLRRRLLVMVRRIPRLHQRVSPALGRLAPPEWQDDPDFDIDYHVRRVALPAPGSQRQLFDFATHFVQQPWERTRPLWEFVVVEGMAHGGAAMVQRMHHTITDGEGGIRMSEQFIDIVPDAPDVEEVVITPSAPDPSNILETAQETVGHGIRRSLGVVQRAASGLPDLLLHPVRIANFGPDLVETARSTMRQVTVTDGAHSPLWTERSLRRRLDAIDVDFDEAYATAKALGGSLNDFFVTGAARGAGAYHAERGLPVESLRMAMPISTRKDRSAGGNSFVPTRVVVPTDIPDPIDHFAEVHARLNATKQEKAIGVMEHVAGLVNVLPTSVLVRFARQQVETVDFATSNVRAANFDLFIAGARITANYPIGPLSGTAFNLTMMSYKGQLNMGLHTDTGAIDDPASLRDHIAEAYRELLASHP